MSTTEYLSSVPPNGEIESRPYTDYRNAKHNIISLMAYLIGVKKENFEPDYSPPQLEIYERLDKEANARIIRNLCRIRTALIQNYFAIRKEFYFSYKNIGSMPELIPADAVQQLTADGVSLQRGRPDADEYTIAVNREISNRIGGCSHLFPDWLNWQYIRALFLMPGGAKLQGLKEARDEYHANRNKYPYQCYLNWPGWENGNILYCDEKFVTMLYEAHEDAFTNLSLVRDVGNIELDNIGFFLEQSRKAIVVVDCENSDPIRLAAALSSLSKGRLEKISKVLLFDSHYTTAEWEVLSEQSPVAEPTGAVNWNILSTLAAFPIERKTVERLYEHKSQVDMTLVAETCKEVYTNGVDSVVLVSSDSDYWALIKSLADIKFLVMVEKAKCGETIKRALESRGIHYCYLDDFYTGASYAIKTTALMTSIQDYLDAHVSLNAKTILDNTLYDNWVQMTDKERKAFYDRYLRKIRAEVDADGRIRLVLGS